jgi:hypothetical protein
MDGWIGKPEAFVYISISLYSMQFRLFVLLQRMQVILANKKHGASWLVEHFPVFFNINK